MPFGSLSRVSCLQEGGRQSVSVASLCLSAAVSAWAVFRGNICFLCLAVWAGTCGEQGNLLNHMNPEWFWLNWLPSAALRESKFPGSPQEPALLLKLMHPFDSTCSAVQVQKDYIWVNYCNCHDNGVSVQCSASTSKQGPAPYLACLGPSIVKINNNTAIINSFARDLCLTCISINACFMTGKDQARKTTGSVQVLWKILNRKYFLSHQRSWYSLICLKKVL